MAGTSLKKADFPESVHGLMNKNKTELLNIIARKDEVEKRLSEQVRKLTETVEHSRNAAAQYANDLKKDNDIIRQQSETIKQMQQKNDELDTSLSINQENFNAIVKDYEKVCKNFNCCFVTLVIAVVVIVGLLIHFL